MTSYFVCTSMLILTGHCDAALFEWKFPDRVIVDLLTPGCGCDYEAKSALLRLIDTKDRAFPAYRRILNDPKTKDEMRGAILSIIALATKTDRRLFRNDALKGLRSPEYQMRQGAIRLIGELGDPRDASLAVALLTDEDEGVVEAALKSLVKIGDERELFAIDHWLNKLEKHTGGKRCHFRDDYDRLKNRLNPH
jgi:hypothetical protein